MKRQKLLTAFTLTCLFIVLAIGGSIIFQPFSGQSGLARAQTAASPTPVPTPSRGHLAVEDLEPSEGDRIPLAHPQLDSSLNRLIEGVEIGQFAAQQAASESPVSREDSVAVTLRVQEASAETVRDFLIANGATVANYDSDYIEAYVPFLLLPPASEQEGVISVSTIFPSQSDQVGSVSGAVTAHGVSEWHSAGYSGQGVRIGVIDTGFQSLGRQAADEVPSSVIARCYTSIGVFTSSLAGCASGGDHGTASTESAYDIAPDASYYVSNPISPGDVQATVRWMISQGVDIINYSASELWDGPGDGTSPFSWSTLRSVDLAVGSGIVWTNSAGNGAMETWYGSFVDVEGDDLHNFEGADECNTFTSELSSGERLTVQLRWEGSWGGASSDLDLQLRRSLGGGATQLVESSEDEQSGSVGHYPREILSLTIPSTGTYCLAVEHHSGDEPSWMQLQAFTGKELEHHTVRGSVRSPAESASPGLLAIGAAAWDNTSTIEDFSSQGPTPDGRVKPDIVGSDGAFSATYRGNWFGTSQASAHVAGLAALARQRFPSRSPQQITEYLKSNASARGASPNNTWGYGFARLPSPGAVQPTPDPSPSPTQTPSRSCIQTINGSATVNGTWTEDCTSSQPARSGQGDAYARFYTFTLGAASDVTITLTSSEDTYLNLRQGAGRVGRVVEFDDDIAPGSNTNSRIEVERLAAGDYTVEATTYYAQRAGSFTLVVEIGMAPTQPTPTQTPVVPTPPTPVPTPPAGAGFIDVSRGFDHACALHSNGSIRCWGANDRGQAAPPTTGRFIAISSEYKGTCAVRDDGAVVCWGSFVVNP